LDLRPCHRSFGGVRVRLSLRLADLDAPAENNDDAAD
jgi:hypothetical protein